MKLLYKKALAVGAAAAVAAGSAYAVYKYMQYRDRDEGFIEEKALSSAQKRILVLGLDGAGKTQFLSALANSDVQDKTTPTDGFNVLSVQVAKLTMDVWEIGGALKVRQYWSNFVQDTDVLVFVLDAADRKRFPEAFDEMHKLLGEPRLMNTPVLVLAHKQDVDNCADPAEVKEALGLEDIKFHRVKIVPTSVTKERSIGVKEVEQLLSNMS